MTTQKTNQLTIKAGTEKTILFNLFNWTKEKRICEALGGNPVQANEIIQDYIKWADEVGISYRLQNLFLNAKDQKGEAMDVIRDNNILIVNA